MEKGGSASTAYVTSSQAPDNPARSARADHHAGSAASTAEAVGDKSAADSAEDTTRRDPREPKGRTEESTDTAFTTSQG
ncbi:hypothetical protein GCM10027031_02330 [Corynebacterium atrinae]